MLTVSLKVRVRRLESRSNSNASSTGLVVSSTYFLTLAAFSCSIATTGKSTMSLTASEVMAMNVLATDVARTSIRLISLESTWPRLRMTMGPFELLVTVPNGYSNVGSRV